MKKDCREVIESRRSIRKFKTDPVPVEHLERIIEAARLAPSGTNRQPWRFVLLTDEEDRQKIAPTVVQPFVCEAPAVFVCCMDRTSFTRKMVEDRMHELVQAEVISEDVAGFIYGRSMPEKVDEVVIPASGYLDMGIAIQNMALQATALGLGSCWVRLFNPRQLHETLRLPERIEAVVLLPVGYPDQAPPPRPRLSREEIIITPGA